jgi:hypothetical protein
LAAPRDAPGGARFSRRRAAGRAVYEFEKFMAVVNTGQRIAPLWLDHSSPIIRNGDLLNDNKPRR